MSDINDVTLSGRLTRDAELRQTAMGTAVAAFGLAVEDYRKGATDNSGKVTNAYTNYLDCSMFGERAEKVAPYLTKGRQLFVRGKVHWSSWEKDGQRHSKVDVTVDDLVLGSQPKGQQDQQAQRQQPQAEYSPQLQVAVNQAMAQPAPVIYDDETPF